MITLTGSGFGNGATVTFDGLEATGVVVHDQTTITCEPPDHPDGFATVVVTNLDGTTGELADTFVYITQSVDPEEGPIDGGTLVTLTISDGGAGIDWFPDDHDLVVTIDPGTGTSLEFTRVDTGVLECVTVAQTCGPADVVVLDLTDAEEPVFDLPGGYTYELPPPTITDITPTSGAAVGGTLVTIHGSFSCATCSGDGTLHVEIGGVPLTSVICSSDTIIGITGMGTNPTQRDSTDVTVAGFTLEVTPSEGSLVQGSTETASVTLTRSGGVALVTLTAGALDEEGEPTAVPRNVTVTFSPNPAADTSTVTFAATNLAAVGPVTVTITGSAPGAPDQTILFELTVDAPEEDALMARRVAAPRTPSTLTSPAPAALPGYSLSVPSGLNVMLDATAPSTVTLTRSSVDFTDPVTLVAGGQRDGLTATFSDNPVTFSGASLTAESTITYDAAATASLQTLPITVLGTYARDPCDVVVTNPDGQTDTLSAGYTYVNAPTVLSIDPALGPDTGGTIVTITGADFQEFAAVAMHGMSEDSDGRFVMTIADAIDVTFVDSSTIIATTGAHPKGTCDVVVTNPDEQRGRLEHGYGYEGWWMSLEGWESYGPEPPPPLPGIPGLRWDNEALLPVPVDGWWMSTSAFGGAVIVVASSRPKDPRRWNQIATFATASAAMLGGSPGIAGVYHNKLVYAASDYTVGTTYPPIRIYDGSFDRELCRLPPTATLTVPKAILSLLVANGTIYLSTFDSGTSSANWSGRIFSLDLNTAVLTPVGAVFPTGHLPYALAWHNGMLWCGTHRQTTEGAAKILRFRTDVADAAWTEDGTFATGYNIAALYSWQGTLYAGTTAAAGTFAQILKRGSAGTWATADTGSGGAATANNGFLAFCVFKGALYASYWNQDTTPIATIRKTTDGVTWTTVYTGSGGTARPFIVLSVDNDELFAVGGGAHLTVAILRSPDGATWIDLTNELPDPEKTALPAVAALVF